MKQKQRLNKIRTYIIQQKKATWTEISNATRIQPKELSGDLKHLLNRNEVTCEQDTKDRRKTWYMLRDEKRSNAEVERFKAIEFLLSLENPRFMENKIEVIHGKHDFHAEMGVVLDKPNESKMKNIKVTFPFDLKSLGDFFLSFTDKAVLIITLEKTLDSLEDELRKFQKKGVARAGKTPPKSRPEQKKKLPKKEEPKREQKKELTWHEVFYGTK
jgi:hypothetical protein